MKPKRNTGSLKRLVRLCYQRGYSAGRRNVPFSLLSSTDQDTTRGWGAGQAALYGRMPTTKLSERNQD